jgi:hypothetical protein
MVRDDFWMAATRFMSGLEIRILEGDNSGAVDLFDLRHAKKVLRAFGTAYGALPENTGDLKSEEEAFLDRSISGLAQDGKIISVRLALFAEMMKGKPWTPATLKEVGDTEGVGLTFLEETFSASNAPPEHRVHQKAAQAVLKSLLPDSGTDIKVQMRARKDLLLASGYQNRPSAFDALIHILDPELRLITPTDPEGSSDGSNQIPPSGQYYQLTHDYLVHSLRDWLTSKQGRTELLLAERSSSWNAKPENRLLPSALDWARIRVRTKRSDWTELQRRMMKRAGRVHGLRALGVLVLAGLLAWGGVEAYGSLRAAGLVRSLRSASIAEVPGIVEELGPYRHWADSRLRAALSEAPAGSDLELHLGLALLPVDSAQVDRLSGRLLTASATEIPVLRRALEPHRDPLIPRLWKALHDAKPTGETVLPAAAGLALYDPQGEGWDPAAGKVADALVAVNPAELNAWVQHMEPAGNALSAPLGQIFRDAGRLPLERAGHQRAPRLRGRPGRNSRRAAHGR